MQEINLNKHQLSQKSKSFTLIELLIILCIFSLLVCLISIYYSKVNVTVNKMECMNNLKSISFASSSYRSDHKEFLLGYRNNGNNWFKENGELMDTRNEGAYWGISYSIYLGNTFDDYKTFYKCPEAKDVKYRSFKPLGQYATYGFNGVIFSGNSTFFKNKEAKVPEVKEPSNTIVCHDAWEPMMEGNRDTPDSNIDQINEYKRHDQGTLTLWLDGHTSLIQTTWNRDWYR